MASTEGLNEALPDSMHVEPPHDGPSAEDTKGLEAKETEEGAEPIMGDDEFDVGDFEASFIMRLAL